MEAKDQGFSSIFSASLRLCVLCVIAFCLLPVNFARPRSVLLSSQSENIVENRCVLGYTNHTFGEKPMRIAVCFLIFGTIVLAAPAPKEVKVPDYFPIKEGSTWSYNQLSGTNGKEGKAQKINITLTKVTVEKDVTKVTFSTELGAVKRIEEFEVNAKEIIIKQTSDLCNDLVIYKKGAKVGDKWSGKVFLGKAKEGTSESVVEEPQEITLGEKKYKCVVTSHQLKFDLGGGVAGGANPAGREVNISFKVWFAPDIGIVKRERVLSLGPIQAATVTQELEEYTPKK